MRVFARYVTVQLLTAELTAGVAVFILQVCPVSVFILTVSLIRSAFAKASAAVVHIQTGTEQLTVVTASVIVEVKLLFWHQYRVCRAEK